MGTESEEEKKSEIHTLVEYANQTVSNVGIYKRPDNIGSFHSFALGDRSSENIENNLSYDGRGTSPKELTPGNSILRRMKEDIKKSSMTARKHSGGATRF